MMSGDSYLGVALYPATARARVEMDRGRGAGSDRLPYAREGTLLQRVLREGVPREIQ